MGSKNNGRKRILLGICLVGLASCGGGGGDDVSGGGNCSRGSVTIMEPAANCTTYTTVASSVGLSGYAHPNVDCGNNRPKQLYLRWNNSRTGQTGTGFILTSCLPFFGLHVASTRWFIGEGAIDLQMGKNVINLSVAGVGTGTITLERVEDIMAPEIANQYPAPDAIDVPNNRILTVRFSEDMSPSSLTDDRFLVVDDSGASVSGLRNYDRNNFTWKFDPSSNLLYSTTYSITIRGGVEDRYGGNILGADISWSFTTGPNPDVTNPRVVQVDPEPGTLCTASRRTILARFDEPLDSATIDTTTFLLKDSFANPVSGSVTYDTVTAQFVPDITLASISTYEATLTTGIRDLAGNPLSNDYSWIFTTDSAPVGGWAPTSTTPFVPWKRYHHSAVWTGTEMIIWGGKTTRPDYIFYHPTNTGGRYDPISDSWTVTSIENAPITRSKHKAVWTGTEMIVWGGLEYSSSGRPSGGRYNPVTDSWQTVSTINAPTFNAAGDENTAVWTGTEMIIWGSKSRQGGRYDPVSDSWQAMSTAGAPLPSPFWFGWMDSVWTGTELIVWGGSPANGARYNPQSDTWTALSVINAPPSYSFIKLMWTGTEMLAWNGGRPTTIDRYGLPVREAPSLRIYNPSTDTWRVTGSNCEPYIETNNIRGFDAYWTGNQMIMWSDHTAVGYLYDPAIDDWQSISARPPRHIYGTSIWASERLILWGGALTGQANTNFSVSNSGFVFHE